VYATERKLARHDCTEKPLLVLIPERRTALKHLEKEDACRPPVKLAAILLVPENLWRQVLRRAANGCCGNFTLQAHFGEPKIRQPDVALLIEKHIFGLHITVAYSTFMQVFQAKRHLSSEKCGLRFRKTCEPAKMSEKLAAAAKVSHEVQL
jgi:hypothetical protein